VVQQAELLDIKTMASEIDADMRALPSRKAENVIANECVSLTTSSRYARMSTSFAACPVSQSSSWRCE